MADDVVIKVENLSKFYRLGLIGGGTLREDVNRWIAKLRGKPDPLLKVGEQEHGYRKNGQIWALRNINLEVREGEILGIIGRNGAGKSTLLKILSKITAPTAGRIKIRGRVGSLLEVGTGFHPELTGRENIYLNGTILGMSHTEVTKKLDEIVDFAEIVKFIDTPVKRYSSGMTVRLAFAVAAHLEPEILVVDEVLAVGDAAFQKKCLGKMEDVAGHGRTVLFVSHNMNSIKTLCTKAVLLESGQVMQIGNSQDITESYLRTVLTENVGLTSYPEGYIYYNNEENVRSDFDITGIQLFDKKASPVEQAATWQFIKIRIHFVARKRVKRGSVVIKVQTREGLPLILCSTEPDSSVPLQFSSGAHFIDCVFKSWPLAEGTYQLGVGLAIPMIEYLCWDDSLCDIHTIGRDVYESGKVPTSDRYFIAAEHHWEMPAS